MKEKKLLAKAMMTAFDTAGASFSQALVVEGAKHEENEYHPSLIIWLNHIQMQDTADFLPSISSKNTPGDTDWKENLRYGSAPDLSLLS